MAPGPANRSAMLPLPADKPHPYPLIRYGPVCGDSAQPERPRPARTVGANAPPRGGAGRRGPVLRPGGTGWPLMCHYTEVFPRISGSGKPLPADKCGAYPRIRCGAYPRIRSTSLTYWPAPGRCLAATDARSVRQAASGPARGAGLQNKGQRPARRKRSARRGAGRALPGLATGRDGLAVDVPLYRGLSTDKRIKQTLTRG